MMFAISVAYQIDMSKANSHIAALVIVKHRNATCREKQLANLLKLKDLLVKSYLLCCEKTPMRLTRSDALKVTPTVVVMYVHHHNVEEEILTASVGLANVTVSV
jgi:hypothetical protein